MEHLEGYQKIYSHFARFKFSFERAAGKRIAYEKLSQAVASVKEQ